jgi:hypothetical protein
MQLQMQEERRHLTLEDCLPCPSFENKLPRLSKLLKEQGLVDLAGAYYVNQVCRRALLGWKKYLQTSFDAEGHPLDFVTVRKQVTKTHGFELL